MVKYCINKIAGSDLKILVIHHPLHNFKEFNYLELQNLIHKEFGIILSGHIHKEQITTQYIANNGIYCNTTQATLSPNFSDEIGFSIINRNDLDETEIKLERYHFLEKSNNFIELEAVIVKVPVGEIKEKQNKLRNKINKKFEEVLSEANLLLLNYEDNKHYGFIESFTIPILSKNSEVENVTIENQYKTKFSEIENLSNNFLIFGKDKSGKTSLLRKIQLHLLKSYTINGLIPFYIDYKEHEISEYRFNLSKLVSRHLEINQAEAEIIINNNLVLLIDNFNPTAPIHKEIVDILIKKANLKFIVCSENVTSWVYQENFDGLRYEKLFIKDLSRNEIRAYTSQNSDIKEEEKEMLFEKITFICTQLQLPLNFWTVSLITLIYKKSNDDFSKNLFGILDSCVDEIFNKKKLLFSKSELKFEQYKELCSQIAYFLLKNHKDNIYSAKYLDIVEFITEYTERNPRVVSNARDVFEFLLESGILKKKNGDLYTFRLNGIFEYFLAYYMKENEGFKTELLKDNSVYLAFYNEIEIYSGFNRKDKAFLRQIYDKTKNVFDKINQIYLEGSLDDKLSEKIGQTLELTDSIKKIKSTFSLSHQQQDNLRDAIAPLETQSDVKLKELVDSNQLNFQILERYIHILARVFKNSDSIEDKELIYEIFDFIINSYCSLGFYLVDDVKNKTKQINIDYFSEEQSNEVIGEGVLKLISNFIPVLTQSFVYDGIGQKNLINIINEKIEDLKKDLDNNQYKLFILYFLLMDLDIKKTSYLIDEVFVNIKKK